MIGEKSAAATPQATGELARELREQREMLRSVETAALAGTAEVLVGVTSGLADLVERIERAGGRNFRTEEELAVQMGYVDEEGRPMKKAFAQMALECGSPRHKTAHNRTFYFLDEVKEALRRLDG